MLKQCNKTRGKGFTLVEMMISMLLSIIVTGGVLGTFMAASNSNKDLLHSIRLTQELRGVMSLITRDLRRAGSWNYSAAIVANPAITMSENPFNQAGQISGTQADGTTCNPTLNDCTYTCVLYTYDQPTDLNDSFNNPPNGVHDGDSEEFGFRLNVAGGVGAIQIRRNSAACDTNGWQNLTDNSLINITNFAVIDHFPEDISGLQIRVLEIRITGQLIAETAIQKDIVEYVRIRNDFF